MVPSPPLLFHPRARCHVAGDSTRTVLPGLSHGFMNISIAVLSVVFVLIAARRLGRFRIKMWQTMLGGALAVLLTGQISPQAALRAIDADVMVFLFGMFILGQALLMSGYLYSLADRLFGRVHSSDGLLFAVLIGGGLGAALLMNDTLAIVAAPLMIRLAQAHGLNPKVLLLALAFAITIGSVMSPIGNPQNLLIATRGEMPDPFMTFLYALGVPTLLNLLLAFAVLRVFFRREFHGAALTHRPADVSDPALARLARLSLLVILVLIAAKMLVVMAGVEFDLRLSYIALAGALPLLLFSRRRLTLLRQMDWGTLIFFAAMFVLMASVWHSGFFQSRMADLNLDLRALPMVMAVSMVLSQLISNVPLVALYLPLLEQGGPAVPSLMALAAGSTIAGNLLILGAASNIIIVQHAERHGVHIGFFEFARVGVPLGLLNAAVYWAYLEWLY